MSVSKLKTGPLRHRWFARTPTPVFDEKTGNERHERVCELCHTTRTTVIPPRGIVWIEWESHGRKSIDGPTPPCPGVVASVQ